MLRLLKEYPTIRLLVGLKEDVSGVLELLVNRSILADPRNPNIKDILNDKNKIT